MTKQLGVLGLKPLVLTLLLALTSLPAQAVERVLDKVSNVSFISPPNFTTFPGPKNSPVHYFLKPPDKSTTFFNGAIINKKFIPVRAMTPLEIKQTCTTAQPFLKGHLLQSSKRYLLDEKNGAICYFATPKGQTLHWVVIPEVGQLLFFYGIWDQVPTADQVLLFRRFVGSVQIF